MNRVGIVSTGISSRLGMGDDIHVQAFKQSPPEFSRYRSAGLKDSILKDPVDLPFGVLEGKNDSSLSSSVGYSEQVSKHQSYLLNSVKQAVAHLPSEVVTSARLGLFVGSTSFAVDCYEALYQSDKGIPIAQAGYNRDALWLRQELGLAGPHYVFATACTSSVNGLLYAERMIQVGDIDYALIVGYEFFNQTTLLGFNSLGLIAKEAMYPFDKRRNGMVLGEACSAVVLAGANTEEGAASRFKLCGGAALNDIHNLTAPNPDGESIARVLDAALRYSNIDKDSIRGIKVHGTATQASDEAEASGIAKAFTGQKLPTAISLKSHLGHTLGACGVTELSVLLACLEDGYLPGGEYQKDAELNIDLVGAPIEVTESGYYLLNYFGFGGNNAVLVLQDTGAVNVG